MAVIVEVADQRHIAIHLGEMIANLWHSSSGFRRINGDAHQFGTCTRQLGALYGSGQIICRIRVGHRLNDDRSIATDTDVGDRHAAGRTLADYLSLLQDEAGDIALGMRRQIDRLPPPEQAHTRRTSRWSRTAAPGRKRPVQYQRPAAANNLVVAVTDLDPRILVKKQNATAGWQPADRRPWLAGHLASQQVPHFRPEPAPADT